MSTNPDNLNDTVVFRQTKEGDRNCLLTVNNPFVQSLKKGIKLNSTSLVKYECLPLFCRRSQPQKNQLSLMFRKSCQNRQLVTKVQIDFTTHNLIFFENLACGSFGGFHFS